MLSSTEARARLSSNSAPRTLCSASIDQFEGTSDMVLPSFSRLQALELKTVAEGVETERQLAWLTQHGCDMAQGYLLSRPLEAVVFEDLIARRLQYG